MASSLPVLCVIQFQSLLDLTSISQPCQRQLRGLEHWKVDDEIDMKQITKSQLCALDDDPTRSQFAVTVTKPRQSIVA
eukprot:2936744-Amphidinium_carterae.1